MRVKPPYPITACDVDDDPQIILQMLLDYRALFIAGYYVWIEESDVSDLGEIVRLVDDAGMDAEYEIDPDAVSAILTGIRTGRFDPAAML